MPELPEVEINKQYFDLTSLNKEITDVLVRDDRILELEAEEFKELIIGNKFKSTIRYGKYLFVELDSFYMLLHFGMSGDLKYFEKMDDEPKYSKIIFHFKNGYYLSYISIRLFGSVEIVKDVNDFIKKKKLGPDAFKMTKDEFLQATKRRNGMMKNLLLNQEFVAGVGNVYSDEILFRSSVSPKRKITDLNEKEIDMIFKQIKEVLKFGINKRGDWTSYPEDSLIPHRKNNSNCPSCGEHLSIMEASGRRGFYCSKCQI